MSTAEVAEETVAVASSKVDEATTQTEEQTMPEEPSLAEDSSNFVADNDESTLGTTEQDRRERRRSSRRKRRDDDTEDDDTYFSTSNETHKREDGLMTKAIDKFVDLLHPVERDMDEDETMASESTVGTTPTLYSKKSTATKPSLMQQLDKHVLTRFGCSSNPAYIPEDEEEDTLGENTEAPTEAKSTEDGSASHGGDNSAYGPNSITRSEDPGDPDVRLKSLDEEEEENSADGARARFFCGALPLKGEKGDSNVMSEITEEKKTDDEQAKGIVYSPSQLEDMPFDQQPPKPAEAEPEAPTEKSALTSFTETFANIRSKVFPQDGGDESPAKAVEEETAPTAETAEPAQVEGETIFEEAAMEGHQVPTKDDDEPSEEGEEVPAIPEEFERKESEMPFDEAAKKKLDEEEEDEENDDEAEVEEEKAPEEESPEEEEPKEEEPQEEAPKEEAQAPAPEPVQPAANTTSKNSKAASKKQTKEKKKKKSIFGKMFKRKSKKNKAPKESILAEDEKKGVSASERLEIPQETAPKETRPTSPVDRSVTNQSKRESWKNQKRQTSKQELDSAADFDLLLTKTTSSKNAANDDWNKLTTSPTTPTKSRPEGSSSSPSGVAEFPEDGRVEL